MRSSYYSDLCSKFMIENTILKMEYAEVRVFSLSDKVTVTFLLSHDRTCSNVIFTINIQSCFL